MLGLLLVHSRNCFIRGVKGFHFEARRGTGRLSDVKIQNEIACFVVKADWRHRSGNTGYFEWSPSCSIAHGGITRLAM
jgi:hypothetical protein